MFRFFLFLGFLVPVFSALPVVGIAEGRDIYNSEAQPEEPLFFFSLVGDSEKTPFRLQITFENCSELRDNHGRALALTGLKLRYKSDLTLGYETMNLGLTERGQNNCLREIEFYQDVQERYDMEAWASWDRTYNSAGNFSGRATFKILPKP